MASNQLDFVDQWVNLTVEKEVLRGSKLREEKLRTYPPQEEYEVVNINLVRPPRVKMNKSHYSFRNRSPGRTKMKTGSFSPRSKSPFIESKSSKSRAYTPQTIYRRPNSPSIKAKYVRRCPMRIAELAVPTKRQCIDTWRNKYDVLPPFMVERLRQQILDQKPVVQIKEAISCFKRRKPRSIKSVKRSNKRIIGVSKQKNVRMDEIRILCAAFANRIAQRLITPQNVKLTPELEKISKVVTAELTQILQNRKKYDLDANTNQRIKAEIADKITIWIAMILEDTSYKILEEDLRVKKHSERTVKEERIVTLIGKLLHRDKASELEEEEGPVLDFIDDLVDNVVTICEPQAIDVVEIDNISETTSKGSGEQFDRSTGTPDSNVTYDTGDDTINIVNETEPLDATNQSVDPDVVEGIELNIDDHIRGELNKVVDSVIPAAELDDGNKDDLENKTDFTPEHKDLLPEAPGNSELTSSKPVQSDTDFAFEEDAILSAKNSFEDGMDDPKPDIENVKTENDNDIENDNDLENVKAENDNDIENVKAENDNDSDVGSDEGSLDDKNKKVKFWKVEMDGEEPGPVESNSALQSVGEKGHQRERLSWHSSIDLHDIVFAPPNDHLLSDADELWPDDITTPILKPSASVNRSITSLGKILEKDEKLQPEDDVQSVLDQTIHTELEIENHEHHPSQTTEQLETVHNLLVHLHEDQIAAPIKDQSKPDVTHEDKPEELTEGTTSSINTIKTREEKAMTDKTVEAYVSPETKRLILDSSTSPIKITSDENSDQNQSIVKDKQSTEKDMKNLESDTNVIYEAVQQKMKSSYAIAEPKHDYKVHANTAPSWLRHDHGKGEPSEDSFQGGKSKEKLNETEIRNWCKDLDRIFVNLAMWNDWIDSTCKNTLYLKQKREMNKLFAPNAKRKDARDWITLKKNIDKDAVLWTKLNQKAHERLKTYKEKSKIVSTEYCMLCDCKNNAKRNV